MRPEMQHFPDFAAVALVLETVVASSLQPQAPERVLVALRLDLRQDSGVRHF